MAMTQADDRLVQGEVRYVEYGDDAVAYLSARDPRMADAIARIGHVWRVRDDELFQAVVHSIVGQQISTRAQATVWARMRDGLGTVDAAHVAAASVEELQAFGMTYGKAGYIRDFALRVQDGSFDIAAVERMGDDEAIEALASLRGVGRWTAEMILTFCLNRPDVFAFDDLAIQRGLRMLYHHRKITRKLFERYRRRFSPYCSVASLYLWEVAGGALPELRDLAQKTRPARKAGEKNGGAARKTVRKGDSAPRKVGGTGTGTTHVTTFETGVIGNLTLASDGERISHCWFEHDRNWDADVAEAYVRKDDLPVFDIARRWLRGYFAGERPDPGELPLGLVGTPFRMVVWEQLLQIPYGRTVTYGELAERVESQTGRRTSARAVGGAVGHNPICVIVPCHRVVGSGGSLMGFAGGVEVKARLLALEGAKMG
ncbi:methylated-DNA--[protein]-cysteine S-methyltransferase [Parafannyhessea umbonata]|uniref:Methylated-DNA--protein-cysteine methyltransferase n=1 Tax=Parafannyhessea umbonata TaxID=604330 RepID=A0A1G6ML99_9ACTN|nr:methylated-DNA--[protein]-cysteine S-methyltransferase [Parafannyhessea umbonata]SDC55756.1 O-6-methylguanine DNA methyltransferase [Parafannyhessea umbonata]